MSRSSDVLGGLTLDQANAAALTGPVLVLAGAGTGKTKTLAAGVTHRIAVRGIPANRILAVTFTNKAAGEIRGRIQAALGEAAAPTWLGTFHGLGARQLRAEPEVAGLRPGFDILEADDSRRMVRRVIKAMNITAGDDTVLIGRDPLKLICNRLSAFKDALVTPGEVAARVEGMIVTAKNAGLPVDPSHLRAAAGVYVAYQRVLRDAKQAGTIVDYVGVFANLQEALAIYGAPKGDARPIRDKEALLEQLEEALTEAETYCRGQGVDTAAILEADNLDRAALIGKAQEALIAPDEMRRGFLRRADAATRAYRAVLPDDRAAPFLKRAAALAVVAQAVRNQLGPPDISALAAKVEALLDANILGVEITAPVREGGDATGLTDLSKIDFEKLADLFVKAPKTAVEQMRSKAGAAVDQMVKQSPTRVDLIEKLEKLIDAYNAATADVAATFEKLKEFIRSLDEEQGRAAREGLSQDELTVYDLLTKPEPKLTKAQDIEVRRVARELLAKLHDKVAVFEWHRRQQTRGDVRWTIEEVLNQLPEEPYPKDIWDQKVEATWQFVFGRPANGQPGLGP